MSKIAKLVTSLVVFFLLAGCQSISYYSQSVIGHSKLMLARVPIEKAIKQAEPELQRKLELSQQLREFASEQLSLPDNKSYSTYVALERDFPVWVVVAAPEFSLAANSWCYLVIGCASYRGYFSESAAHQYAAGLSDQGLETYVGGAPAYSTLGWFSDPLLPSMINYSDALIAEMLFHELAHQVLYVKDDSEFNEAFASVVAEQGVLRWLRSHQPNGLSAYQQNLAARRDFSELIEELKLNLQKVYESELDDSQKRIAKQQQFDNFKQRYNLLKNQQWGGVGWFDGWLKTPINNARLAAYLTYHKMVPDLNNLFESCDSNFNAFFRRLKNNHNLNDTDNC